MIKHYLLWAIGQDRPGIVAGVTESLFQAGCNLEDSSMMRLGSEFGIILILSSNRPLDSNDKSFLKLQKSFTLTLGVKPISSKLARFVSTTKNLFIVTVHGHDHPGIVFHVTSCLSKNHFNITDLATHRTTQKKGAGYILFVEGELLNMRRLAELKKQLHALQKKIDVKISLRPLTPAAV